MSMSLDTDIYPEELWKSIEGLEEAEFKREQCISAVINGYTRGGDLDA